MNNKVLFDDGKLKWIVFGRDHSKANGIIDTNEYLIVSKDDAILLDPGGSEIFPYVLSAVSEEIDLKNLKKFFASHQDPDIFSSLPLWMAICPDAQIYLPWMWSDFLAHFGKESYDSFVKVPDKGMEIQVGESPLQIVPAHYLHSSGNNNVFCPTSGIFFSGDIGSALVPEDYPFWVEDFEQHTKYMKMFHERWMPSNVAKNSWIRRVRAMNPSMICPQHGAIFKGENVKKFLDWLENLEVGKAEL
ncbi:MAG: MBL fold metallo-hydrolase [Bacteriovoracaceae bacterium]